MPEEGKEGFEGFLIKMLNVPSSAVLVNVPVRLKQFDFSTGLESEPFIKGARGGAAAGTGACFTERGAGTLGDFEFRAECQLSSKARRRSLLSRHLSRAIFVVVSQLVVSLERSVSKW